MAKKKKIIQVQGCFHPMTVHDEQLLGISAREAIRQGSGKVSVSDGDTSASYTWEAQYSPKRVVMVCIKKTLVHIEK